MESVLGIDAAWTDKNPSGIALIARRHGTWNCLAAAPSQEEFLQQARVTRSASPGSASPGLDPRALLQASRVLLGSGDVTVTACDMPLSLLPITSRRAADNSISGAFGRFKLGTHTPSATRPGPIADELRRSFEDEGFRLATTGTQSQPALLEVYPHTALIALLREKKRLPYKESRVRKYWPDFTPDERRDRLREVWTRIAHALAQEIEDLPTTLLAPKFERPWKTLKRIEDTLDAVICAWVGARFIAGEAYAYGDGDAAIWSPSPPEFDPPLKATD